MELGARGDQIAVAGGSAGVSFAHPELLTWLWGIPGIFILYLMRRPAKTIDIPHLFLWERVVQNRLPKKRRRLRELLGLLLQILIATFLILALSGPRQQSVTQVDRSTLFVFDNSLSMRATDMEGRSRSDRAKKMFREELTERLKMGSCALVFAADHIVSAVPFSSEIVRFDDILKEDLQPRGLLDSEEVVDYAREVKAVTPDVDLVFVSDRCLPTEQQERMSQMGFGFLQIPAPGSNIGFTSFEINNSASGRTIDVDLSAFGAERLKGKVLLASGAEVLAEKSVLLAPGTRTSLSFEMGSSARKWLSLKLQTERDCFAPDDVIDFWLTPPKRLKVLVVAEKIDRFLKSALSALDSVFDLSAASQANPSEWRGATGYDLTILVGLRERRPLPPGRYLLFDSWAPNLPFKEGIKVREIQVVRQSSRGSLLRGIDLRDLQVKTASRLSSTRGVDVLLEGTHGPLISRGQKGGVEFLHLSFSLSPENSSLVLLPAFPLLIKDAARYLMPKQVRILPPALLVGARFSRPALVAGDEPIVVEFLDRQDPQGNLLSMAIESWDGANRLPDFWGRARFYLGSKTEMCGLQVCDSTFSNVFPLGDLPHDVPVRPRLERSGYTDRSALFYLVALVFLLLEWLCYTRDWTR